ncbi:MAG TPA: hypothetical protein P5277_03775 [Candidatus Paceibacterota bacterium]|nr:hypothetical protein [Candidatus Paceibacterota bacterium]
MKKFKINFKKGSDNLTITKLITITLVLLVVIAVIFFLFNQGYLDDIINLPGFHVNTTVENVDLRECPVIIGRLVDNQIIFCGVDYWEKKGSDGVTVGCDSNSENVYKLRDYNGKTMLEFARNFELIETPLYVDFKDQKIKVGENSIGTLVIDSFDLDQNVLDGSGDSYTELTKLFNGAAYSKKEDPRYYLDNLNNAFLFGNSYICRKDKLNYLPYLNDILSINTNENVLYYNLLEFFNPKETDKIYLFLDKNLNEMSKSFIDRSFNIVYLEDLSLDEISNLKGDYTDYIINQIKTVDGESLATNNNGIKKQAFNFHKNHISDFINDKSQLGWNSNGNNLDQIETSEFNDKVYIRLGYYNRRELIHPTTWFNSNEIVYATPWIRAEYFLIKGKEAFFNLRQKNNLGICFEFCQLIEEVQ